MHPKHISIEDYSYELPDEKIALFPAHPRDISRLLVYDRGNISEDIYRHIDQYLPDNSALVFNDTRVVKSRILFKKSTGSVIELFCLEPYGEFTDYETVFQNTESASWKCLIGKAGKWKEKQLVRQFYAGSLLITLTAELTDKLTDAYVVRFSWTPGHISFGEVISNAGVTPLPPYIKRKATIEDESDYQTVYSEHDGSVAAPTAGLHFTHGMMEAFQRKGIPVLFTTLHVGAGTFKPVKSATMEGHIMHEEWMNITLPFLASLRKNIDKDIISVGTTATRTLESIYWMGNKIMNRKTISAPELKITQWEVYDAQKTPNPEDAIDALIAWMEARHLTQLLIETGIIIAPGYNFQVVKGLITNFHQPKSTLLLLVAALAGKHWRDIYNYALNNHFRFLSYGDGCLIMP